MSTIKAQKAKVDPKDVDDLASRVEIVLKIAGEEDTICREARTRQRDTHSMTRRNPQIESISQLKYHIPSLCRTVFDTLGKQQPEGAYQRALEVELEMCGVSVNSELSIDIMYRRTKISSRRVDMMLVLADGTRAIVEMKAVKSISHGANHAQQIEYYLHAFQVTHGFLINFPHDTGFPAVESAVFKQELLCGLRSPISDFQLRERKDISPEIAYFHRIE